jgi:hypothetical protein
MKRLTQYFPILLAAALQIMPLLRSLFVNPATSSNFAFILRWGIGSAAAMGAVDAVSGASPKFTSITNFTGTVGTAFTNSVVVDLTGTGNPASTSDGFTLTNLLNTTIHSAFFANGKTNTVAMPPGLQMVTIAVNNANFIYGSMTGTPTTAGTYHITVTCTSPGNASITTNVFFTIAGGATATPPGITSQPGSRTNLVGATPSFSVTANGSTPLAYQWYFNASTALLNATNATLALTNVLASQAGAYSVVITNSAGAITSTPAQLTVWQAPLITNQPAGVTTVAGGSASFSVTAGGIPAPTYQWQLGGVAQSGATTAGLSLSRLRSNQSGNYSVIVANSAGSVTSSIAPLAVTNPLPAKLTTATSVSQASGFQFSFTPIVGLTNTVQTNSAVTGGTWGTLTNVPPPASATPVTVTDALGNGSRFYRVLVQP